MTYITDRHHLATTTQRGIAALLDLQETWLEEDHLAHAPTSSGQGTSSNTGPSDPTSTIAARDRKTRDRDHIGGFILRHVTTAEQFLERRQPRTPTERCHCCHHEMATHGPLCWACDRYLRSNGYPCDDELHHDRAELTPAMCECPDTCCDVCPDRAADGRTVSDRCRQRMTRRRQAEQS